MKKKLLLIILLLLPLCISAETCNSDNISIQSINAISSNGFAIEKSPATIKDKKIHLNIEMDKVGDSITYNILVKNEEKTPFEIDENSFAKTSEYIEYSILSKDKTIEPQEEKEIQLRVSYNKEVDESDFQNGIYNNNQEIVVNLSNNNNIQNPTTFSNILLTLLIIMIILSLSIFIISKKNKKKTLALTIIAMFLFLPMITNAICKVEIKIDSNVEIEKINFKKFYIQKKMYGTYNEPKEYEFVENMTWNEWLHSKYNINHINFIEGAGTCTPNTNYMYYQQHNNSLYSEDLIHYDDGIEENHTYIYGTGDSCMM